MPLIARLPNMVIAASGTDSNALSRADYGDANSITIQAPAALTGTLTVQSSVDGSTWATKQSGGTDISVAASKTVTITDVSDAFLRMHSSASEAAERTFMATKQWGVPSGR